MKYIDADKLIAEIERLGRNWDGVQELQPASLFQADLYELLSIITSLQREQPEELEKKIDDWYNTMGIPVTTDALKETARHFYELGLNARND